MHCYESSTVDSPTRVSSRIENVKKSLASTGKPQDQPTVSIVIPTFQSQTRIAQLATALISQGKAIGIDFEIIFVDDASTDQTWNEILKLSTENSLISGIRLAVNSGQHIATLTGLRAAHGDVCITMDDDFQHPPSAIPQLLVDCISFGGNQEVVNAKLTLTTHPTYRKLSSKVARVFFARLLGVKDATHYSSLRAIERAVIERLHAYQGPNLSVDVLLRWVSSRIAIVEVTAGTYTASRYSFRTLAKFAITSSIGYSKRPLYLAILIGCLLLSLSGIGLLSIISFTLLYGALPPGFLTLIGVITMIGGTQILLLGTLSLYFASVFDRMLGRSFGPIAETANREAA